MEGYSDDMDTLLVFAGLFSAILTAFVVQTYPLLQPSSTDITNQLLAANNRMLVQGFTAILTGISSGPLTSLLVDDPPPFQPRTSARWINCLFFTSLVLSLAAALFAILIKQWIREYMEWSSPLSLPRENVLVRQWRFESWETWSIAAVISTVPAFLEIAMILFLIGIIILLWTMDNIVAICVTVVIAGFLLVVAIFTVLPVFFRRCPYKSPTAWALVLASYGLPLFATYCLSWCTLYAALLRKDWASGSSHTSPGARHGRRGWYMSEFARYVRSTIRILSSAPDPSLNNLPKWTSLPRRWRELDLAACRSSGVRLGDWKASMEQLEIAAEEAIESESQDSVEETREVQDRRALVNTLIINIRESSILHRALSWVTTSSQNSHIIDYINQCSQIEAEGSHRSGLQGLLCLGKQIGSVDKGWHLSLLEFIISGGQSSTGSHSELLLKIYPETLENYKVRMSAETGNLGEHLYCMEEYDQSD
ncbi:hypothetical protein PsYK624_118940 [Phanerochaete sordida]|uniref:DUF6535 domain-containing protein n=1 Tax=Phanerochaete sordida TaxID=48140 RepID=A0A9P3GIT2_9APHY|nr:hypothetical protein PsYK624_118940 [Phanerochaete sordida]